MMAEVSDVEVAGENDPSLNGRVNKPEVEDDQTGQEQQEEVSHVFMFCSLCLF